MKKLNYLWVLVLLPFFGCSSLDVSSDYDPGHDFSNLKTFRFATEKESSKNDLLAQNPFLRTRLHSATKNELTAKGYQYVESGGADFVVNIMAGKKDKTSVTSTPTMSYGYGYGYWGGYYGGSNVTVTNYTEGTLLMDIIDTQKNQLVWRGTVTDVIDGAGTTTEEKQQYLDYIVNKVLADFPPDRK